MAHPLDPLIVSMQAAMPTRILTRELTGFEKRKDDDLKKGVITLLMYRESGFANYVGREAQWGKLTVLLTAQLRLTGDASGTEVEAAEVALADEIKQYLQGQLPLSSVLLLEINYSGQVEAPYGWITMKLEVIP